MIEVDGMIQRQVSEVNKYSALSPNIVFSTYSAYATDKCIRVGTRAACNTTFGSMKVSCMTGLPMISDVQKFHQHALALLGCCAIGSAAVNMPRVSAVD